MPHFEKMLYDNALLAEVYLDAWRTTRRDLYRRVARETLEFVLGEMTDPAGPFYSSLDADSEGEEGKSYVWRPAEVIEVLGSEEGALVNAYYGITERGNFEGGASIPHVEEPLESFAERARVPAADLERRLDAARRRLLERRRRRAPPRLDDKVLTAWNGLMIAAFAEGGRTLGERRYIEAATRAADFILSRVRGPDGLLRVSHRAGRTREEAFLDDQAFVAKGLLALHEVTGEARWLDAARGIVKAADAAFWDEGPGGYFFAPAGRPDLLVRAKNPLDGATPSGNSVMAACLLELARRTMDEAYARRCTEILAAFSGGMRAMPGAFHNLLLVLDEHLAGGGAPPGSRVTVAVSGPSSPVGRGERIRAHIRLAVAPGWHVNAHRPSMEDLVPTTISLEPGGPASLVGARYPEPKMVTLGFAGRPLALLEGVAGIDLELEVGREAAPGAAVVSGRVSFQACNDRACLPPTSLPFELALTIVPPTAR